MKKTDKISYRQKSASELNKELAQLSTKLVELRAKIAMGSQKDTSQVKKIKYQIALISTLLKEDKNDN